MYDHINVVDDKGQIMETFHNKQHMYDVLTSRYYGVKNKRQKEVKKSFTKGYLVGMAVATLIFAIISMIFK